MEKMKCLSVLSFALLLATSSLRLNAQPISPVFFGNMPQFLTDMDDYYNGIMQIPLANIAGYLNSTLPVSPPNNDYPTPVTIVSMNSTSIAFDWPNVASATEYRIGYLNLKTGANATVTSTASDYTFNSLPNGFYMFVFQSGSGGNWGKANIIIIDKVVHLTIDEQIGCRCENGVHDTLYVESGVNFPLQDFPAFKLDLLNTAHQVAFAGFFEKVFSTGEGANISFYLNPYCGISPLNELAGVFYTDENNPNSLLFGSNGINFWLEYDSDFPYAVEIVVCKKAAKNRDAINSAINMSRSSASLFPLPFSHELSVAITEPIGGVPQFSLMDMMGRIWPVNTYTLDESIGSYRLDTQGLPKGLYLLRIRSAGHEQTYKVVKS